MIESRHVAADAWAKLGADPTLASQPSLRRVLAEVVARHGSLPRRLDDLYPREALELVAAVEDAEIRARWGRPRRPPPAAWKPVVRVWRRSPIRPERLASRAAVLEDVRGRIERLVAARPLTPPARASLDGALVHVKQAERLNAKLAERRGVPPGGLTRMVAGARRTSRARALIARSRAVTGRAQHRGH
ncbi:MAG: hypothetical protein ACYCUG_06105 [Acidimicrobiales bacterium]